MPGFTITGDEVGGPRSDAETHRAHRWKITSLGRDAQASVSTVSGSDLLLFARSVKLPYIQFEEERVMGGSTSYSFAKVAAWQDVEISFYDVYGLFPILDDWRKQIWNPDDGMNVADEYKGQAIIELTDGNGDEVTTFKMRGAWPKAISHGELSYTSSDIKLLSVTLSYDWAEITHHNR